jgi:putative aldouronate transport system permease protein
MKTKYSDFTKISKTSNVILNIIMIIASLCCILPLVLVLSISLTDERTLTRFGYHLIPKVFSIHAYTYVLSDFTVIMRAYGVTIFVTVVGSLLSLTIISLFAYVISRKDFKTRRFFTVLVVVTTLFNGGMVPWYMVYTNILGVQDTIWAMILPYLMTPLYVLILRTFFTTTIPDAVIESAKIDGAGEFKIFRKIVLPLAKPSLASIGLFNVLLYWNDWYSPMLFISNESLYNMQYLMYRINMNILYLSNKMSEISNLSVVSNIPSRSAQMAMAMIAIGPIILAYPFFQKYFIEGLTLGSVKG